MKRFLSVLLVASLLLALPMSASAAIAKPPSRNTELESVTVSVPYFPDLKITMTNVPYLVGEISANPHQVKFYWSSKTTVSFNQPVSLGPIGRVSVSLKAGESFKPSAYNSGNAIGVMVITEDGKYQLSNSNSISIGPNGEVYLLSFSNVNNYKGNIAEGYQFTDIRDWESTNSLASVSTYSVANSVATIKSDYNSDGKTDHSYSIPGVTKAEKVTVVDAKKVVDRDDLGLIAVGGQQFNMYTVKVGTKIDLENIALTIIDPVVLDKDGKINNYILPDSFEYNSVRKITSANGSVRWQQTGVGNNWVYAKGMYYQLIKEGYYVFTTLGFAEQHYIVDPETKKVDINEEAGFRYNAVVLHVVK